DAAEARCEDDRDRDGRPAAAVGAQVPRGDPIAQLRPARPQAELTQPALDRAPVGHAPRGRRRAHRWARPPRAPATCSTTAATLGRTRTRGETVAPLRIS